MSAFDETFDWVVVGSGAGSMASALVMRTAGKSVLILEKSAFIGGTTAKSGGVIWVPNNRFLKADGEQDSVEAGISYLDAACADLPGSGHDKRLAYVNQAYRMIDFLVDQGVELERGSKFWPDYYDELPGGCKPAAPSSPGRSTRRNWGLGRRSCARASSKCRCGSMTG
jgi:3-oxosteroid 1-dehydrogenase